MPDDSPRSSFPESGQREPALVRAMFDRIAARYDLANHLLSGGIDVLWRARAARMVSSWRPRRILDLATGSGDLAIALARALPESEIIAADFSAQMLELARRKGVRHTVLADAMQLPFPDRSFDCVTVAFGLRNMSDWGGALREMGRVLDAHGHLLILDFSIPARWLRGLYRFYLHSCLPSLAAAVTRQKDAYNYLGASIESFPSGDAMLRLIEGSGFQAAAARVNSGGIATIYTAERRNRDQ